MSFLAIAAAALALAPSVEAEVGLATAARKLGDAPRAIAALRRAVALDTEDADSWNELGALLLQREKSTPPSRHSSARSLSGLRTRCSCAIYDSRVV